MVLRKSIITDITLPNSNVKNEPHNKKKPWKHRNSKENAKNN